VIDFEKPFAIGLHPLSIMISTFCECVGSVLPFLCIRSRTARNTTSLISPIIITPCMLDLAGRYFAAQLLRRPATVTNHAPRAVFDDLGQDQKGYQQ
jgi:hypothetical protein